jgi:hypothetical protein
MATTMLIRPIPSPSSKPWLLESVPTKKAPINTDANIEGKKTVGRIFERSTSIKTMMVIPKLIAARLLRLPIFRRNLCIEVPVE